MADTSCLKCQGTGWVLEEKEGRPLAKRCRCYKENRKKTLFEQANLPQRYKNCSFENFEIHNDSHRDALKISRQFVKNFPVQDVGLLFQGPCGVGKTHLAVALVNELVEKKEVPCYFCDFREFIRDIQNSYSANSAVSESEVMAPVFAAKVLLLDELGAKKTTPWVEETVYYIINHRYNNKKLTVFTSNYIDRGEEEEDQRDSFFKKTDFNKKGEDSLIDRIGVRLVSRIYEMCKIVDMWGDDYRKKVKQAGYRF